MQITCDEFSSIVKRALDIKFFANSPVKRALLDFHAAHPGKHLTAYQIWTEALGNHPDTYNETAEAAVRQIEMDVRNLLADMACMYRIGWVLKLHKAVPRLGYALDLVRIETSATRAFWLPHAGGRWQAVVVTNEPLFYRDAGHTVLVRYPTKGRVSDLPSGVRGCDGGDVAIETRPFKAIGEVQAEQCILTYLDRSEGIAAETTASHRMNDADLQRVSPIILGNPRNNHVVRELLGSLQHQNLGYRMAVDGRSLVEIANPTAAELDALRARSMATRPGVTTGFCGVTDNAVGYSAGLVVRLPNAHGGGPLTLVLSDYPRALPQIAKMLTDETLLRPIFDSLGWATDQPLPESFQWLVAIDLGHEGFGNAARRAEFIGCRVQGDSNALAHAA